MSAPTAAPADARAPAEFVYRLGGAGSGLGPGAHASRRVGAGQAFAAHARLFDHPDPRRLDLRASLRQVPREWLVRLARQRAAVPVYAVVDVSASMRFGVARSKLQVAADFVQALGFSAFRAGDPVGLLGFDRVPRDELAAPARWTRGMGPLMAALLRQSQPADDGDEIGDALRRAVERLAGRRALVFLVSDFHWPLDALAPVLDLLAQAKVVPLVVWSRAESEPAAAGSLLTARDNESGAQRTLWLRESLREQWHAAVARRRREIVEAFRRREIAPFWMLDRFDAVALSRYFLEASP